MTLDTLYMVVRRLANQTMIRYYLDAKGDGSADTVAIEVYDYGRGTSRLLLEEMAGLGFVYHGESLVGNLHDTGVPEAVPLVKHRWEASRT